MIKKNSQNQKQIQSKINKKDSTNCDPSNSGFSKKCKQLLDSTDIKHTQQQQRKQEDIQDKKKSKCNRKKTQKTQKEAKQKNNQNNPKEIEGENVGNKQLQEAYQNQGNNQNYGEDSAKEISNFVLSNIEKRDVKIEEYKGSDDSRNKKNQQLVSSCSVDKLKRIRCEKIQDTDFFEKSQHHNPSKRLLILQYKDQQVYIHQNNQKQTQQSNIQIKKVPDTIKNVFQKKQCTFFNDFPTLRIPTEQTYDTSNPSTVQNKITPSSLTPRSNQSFEHFGRDRTYSYQKQMTMNYIPIYQEEQIYKYDYQQYYNYINQQQGKVSNRKRRIISYQQSKAFIIDTSKIEIDGRTTIMIRNIPNKYTHDMLLELINRNNKKKFDFFYLPIDYTNSCNMGYAFVNFIHTKFIKEFYKQFNGQKWEKFNSQKICSLSYARIQGTFSLINHFQNAGVMYQKQRRIRPLIDVNQQFMNNLSTIIQRQKQNN